ncbi:MAG: IS110 family transposase, partial [Sciscionella sp.]
IKDHIDRHPDLKNKSELLRSIPGVGETTLASILAYLPDTSLFKSAKQVAAWIGLNPRQHQSGSSVRGRTFLAKTGHATLRKALYMPALVACRYNPVLKAFYERLVAAGKNRKAAVCAVMRKLVHMIFGVLKHQQPFNPNWQAC